MRHSLGQNQFPLLGFSQSVELRFKLNPDFVTTPREVTEFNDLRQKSCRIWRFTGRQ